MNLSRETREYHKMLVREAMVKVPSASIAMLQKSILGSDNVSLGEKYVSDIRNKIQRRENHELGEKLNKILLEKKYRLDVASKELWDIVKSPRATKDAAQARIAALRELREWHKDYLTSLFDSGIFERELGVIKNQELIIFADLVELGNTIRGEYNKKNAIQGTTTDSPKGNS